MKAVFCLVVHTNKNIVRLALENDTTMLALPWFAFFFHPTSVSLAES